MFQWMIIGRKKIEAIKIHKSQITEEFLLIIQQYFGLKANVYGEKK